MTEKRRPIRIANCSGFYGDRLSAMAEMLEGGEIDVITGDYLAEVTMLILAKDRLKDPQAGYAKSFQRQIEPLLERIAARGVKVVVNAGGLAPAALAAGLRTACAARRVQLKIAHIEGDDILDRLDELKLAGHTLSHLDTGEPMASWSYPPLTANAYLGAWGIVAALREGADIVICPRVTDASVVLGPAAWWHDWRMDDWNALAGAVVAGHVIECGTQATGGNYSGFEDIVDLRRPGFPLAEIAADGASVITKHPGTGGNVTMGTVTAQLLYEIQGLDYLNPDVTVQLDTIRLSDQGEDRVLIEATRGTPPPPTTKVAITAIGGFENSMMFVLTGVDPARKARLVEQALRARLAGADIRESRFELIGAIDPRPASQLAATTFLRVCVHGTEAAVGRAFFDACMELALASYPGMFTIKGGSRTASAYGVYWPAIVPQDILAHVTVLEDGRRVKVPLPPVMHDPSRAASTTEAPLVTDFGDNCEQAPLGALFDARSGDKGGNGNVGIWARDEQSFDWLRRNFTSDRLRELIPEAHDLEIERHVLPNLLAVNFLLKGLLDGGATETMRFDSQAKALGEYLLSRSVPLPRPLLLRAQAKCSRRPLAGHIRLDGSIYPRANDDSAATCSDEGQ